MLLYNGFHRPHVCSYFKISEHFDKFAEVFGHEMQDAVADYLSRGWCVFVCCFAWVFIHLPFSEWIVKQLLSSLDKYLFFVHIVETDQDQLDLLKESAAHNSLNR